MYLYLYHSAAEKQRKGQNQSISDRSELLVRKALKDYLIRIKQGNGEHIGVTSAAFDPDRIRILRTEKGKPYFSLENKGTELQCPVLYSVSHSGDWWGCLMAEEAVGFDLEVYREKVYYEKIAKRFFAEAEYEYVLKTGMNGFFELWVRKEAFVKYLGTGLSFGMSRFSTVKDGELTVRIPWEKSSCFVLPCKIQYGVHAAYCCGSGSVIRDTIFLK